MATLTGYKGLDVVEGATGAGGIALTGNFKELADRAPNQSASDPGVNDDSTKGFAPGDQWLNTTTQFLWACVSSSTGAAVWKSLYKRTATGLELIPGESAETVQVAGGLRVNGSVGVNRTAADAPVEVQQAAGDGVGGIRVYNNSGSQAAELVMTTGGSVLLRRATQSSPVLIVGSTFRLQGGNVGIGGGSLVPTALLDVEGNTMRLRNAKTPASATAAGDQGDICWDNGYVYVCVATNTWKRAALATW